MSLDGLRAWIGEVERKLGKRTRVFLALTVIAIGIAGASVYLAIDTRDNAVSESDVQALQEKLEARIDALGATGATLPAEPEAQPEAKSKAEPESKKKGSASATPGSPANSAKLQEAIEEAQEKGK